jgi:hypothetical protein
MMEFTIPPDAFALEELHRQYQSADARGRIAILQSNTLPFEIARLAVEDPNIEVRQWFARNGREYRQRGDSGLLEILRNDHDPFVRACVYANPAFLPLLSDAVTAANSGPALAGMLVGANQRDTWWREATHLERLGMARNREFQSCLLNELKTSELGLNRGQQEELIRAFLAQRDFVDHHDSGELWNLISEWPEESDVPPLVYRFLPVRDRMAAEVYIKTGNARWRRAILQMVWDEDVLERSAERYGRYGLHNETLDLAIKDANGVCRLLAYATLRLGHSSFADRRDRSKHWQDLQGAASSDIYALTGLAKNVSLSPRELRRVQRRAYALVGSLKREENLWINLGGDNGYPICEENLPSIIRGDVEQTISKLQFERELRKLRVSHDNRVTDESKAQWTQDEKIDYLTSISLSTSMWAIFTQHCGVATGLGLIVFSLTYVLGNSLAVSLFLFLSCSWLGWLLANRLVRKTQALPPWENEEKNNERLKRLWGEDPRGLPLIDERPIDPEMEARRQKREEWRENYRKEQEERKKHLEAFKRQRNSLQRRIKRNWYLVKRKRRSHKGQ